MDYYVEASLELHLFFGRIMKEHALFLEAGYTDAACEFKKEAKTFKEAFEDLLRRTVECSKGIVRQEILESGEIVTGFTLQSEKATAKLTGATIDFEITKMEEKLHGFGSRCTKEVNRRLAEEVSRLNQRALQLLECFIEFKEATLDHVLNCRMFTINYPLLIEHIIREAKLYQQYVNNLESRSCSEEDLRDVELFWNQIMMEHALFIRGLLDPTEGELINTANQFAGDYAELLNQAQTMTQRTMETITDETLAQTMKYRDFKMAGTKGINACEIRGLILPLLADHVLREANHYIRILEEVE